MISRSKAIKKIMDKAGAEDLVLSTTGMISIEVFMHNDRHQNFYMIGSMGLASSFALGIAKSNPNRKIILLDGDGSFLMNLVAAACIGFYNAKNIVHIVLDNFSYESTGSQNSISKNIDLCNIAKSSGYKFVKELVDFDINNVSFDKDELSFYRIHVGIESNEEISRVTHSPEEITKKFKLQL